MKLQILDLGASYGADGKGFREKRLIDSYGNARLSQSLWEAGHRAASILDEFLAGKFRYDGLHHLAEFLPSLVRESEVFLDTVFFPDVVEMQANGVLNLRCDTAELGGAPLDLAGTWKTWEFPDKVEFLCQIMDGLLPVLQQSPDFVPTIKRLAAEAVLIWLDDALIADVLDGSGLDSLVSGIEKLRNHLDGPQKAFAMFDLVRAQTKRDTARSGAQAKNAENRAMKRDVFAWLDANMSQFKSLDSAAEAIAGKVAPIAFRTARAWVGEWKKLRSAGTP